MNTNEDLIKGVSDRTGLPKGLVKEVMNGLVDYVMDEISEYGEVYVPKLFYAVSHEVSERRNLDPHTRQWTTIPQSYRLTLRASSAMREAYKNSWR